MTCAAYFNVSRAYCVTIKMCNHGGPLRKRRPRAPWPRTLEGAISGRARRSVSYNSPLDGATSGRHQCSKGRGLYWLLNHTAAVAAACRLCSGKRGWGVISVDIKAFNARRSWCCELRTNFYQTQIALFPHALVRFLETKRRRS